MTDDADATRLLAAVERVLDDAEDAVLAEELRVLLTRIDALLDRARAIAKLNRRGQVGQPAREVLDWVYDSLADLAALLTEGAHR